MLVGSSESRIDCANLIKQIYGEVYDQKLAGTVINRYPQYTPLESKDMASEGDLVFFKINKSVPSHEGGVFTTWNIFSYHSWRWCDD